MNKSELLEKTVLKFNERYVKPLAKEIDQSGRFPEETVKLMSKYGLMGLPFPTSFGGVGASYYDYINTVRLLARECATTSVILSAHTSLCASPIFEFGSKELKEKYLPKLLSGEWLGAFALTEPNAGTDSASQQTKAVDMGDHFILTGSKIFITNAGYADLYIIFAMTSPELGTKGISAFVVEADTKGFSVGPKENKMGIRGSSTCELILDHVKVPKENLLGRLNGGFRVAMQTLDGGRIGIAAQALGIAEGALDRTLLYVKQRKQFGRPLAAFQNTQFQIAEMATKVEAAKLLVFEAVKDKENKRDYSKSAAMAKLYASKIAVEVALEAIQLHGGYGYIVDYDVERFLRDAKITEIYEGTSEVQKMVISGKVLR